MSKKHIGLFSNSTDVLRDIFDFFCSICVCFLRKISSKNIRDLALGLGWLGVQSELGRPKLSKTGPSHIRAVLYMAAVVASRHNPHVKALYERLVASGKSKMSALGAVMRKRVHLCFGVIKNRQPYNKHYSQVSC